MSAMYIHGFVTHINVKIQIALAFVDAQNELVIKFADLII